MDRYFLHTAFSYEDSSGIPVRTHPDADELPVVNVYSSLGVFIESPTTSKTTEFYATGHYKWTHNWRLYTLGNKYYYVINWKYDAVQMHSEREYFTWSYVTLPDGDGALDYNRNLFKSMKPALESYSELLALCPTIMKGFSRLDEVQTFPVLCVSIFNQGKIPDAPMHIATMRRTFLLFRFYHNELQDTLLLLLNDMLNRFLTESDTYDGLKFKDANGIFRSFSLIPDLFTEQEPGVVWDETKKLYYIGCRYIHDGICQ